MGESGGDGVRGRRGLILAIGLPLALLTIVPSGLLAFFTALSCGGDGGSPYAARASLHGRACEAGLVNVWSVVILLVPPALAIIGVVRLASTGRRNDLVKAIVAPVAALLLIIAIGTIVPSECSDAQKAAGADCEVY